MQLLNLPYELIVQIASNLDPRDIKSFTTVNSRLYQCSLKESLWYDLVRLNNIHYIHPDITYKALYLSGEIPQMCYHIKNLHISDQKIERLWSYINQHYNPKKPEVFCLHSSCKFIGTIDEFERFHKEAHHSIALKLSMLQILEIWCNSCNKAIGFDGFQREVKKRQSFRSEKYWMSNIMQRIMDPATEAVIRGRRLIEHNVCYTQYRYNTMHIVDKQWYATWENFISGKSNVIPDQLHNKHLYKPNGDLRPDLVLGQDFELINGPSRWYIERVYGAHDTHILSTAELPYYDSDYCRLIHKIRIRYHMNLRQHSPVMLLEN